MSKEIGTLVVVVLKARNLRDKHTIHKQDVYAQATLNKDTKKTKVDTRGGQHPVWDEELRFPIVKAASDDSRKLEVSCFSVEPRQDDLCGRGSIDISETLKTGEFDDWVPLELEDGTTRGEVFLEMTFYAAAPPLQRRASKWAPADRLKRQGGAPGSNGRVAAGGKPHATSNKHDALPPLPEEPPLPVPASSSPPKFPSSLLPGGGAVKRASPKSGAGLLPPEQSVQTQASIPDSHESSLPAPRRLSVDAIPAHLRPGGGIPRTQSPGHPRTPSIPVPVGHSRTPSIPVPMNHSRTPSLPVARRSLDSVPPYMLPGAGASHAQPTPAIPEPQMRTPEVPFSSPPQSYQSLPPPPTQPYNSYGSTIAPPHSFGGTVSPQPPSQLPAYGSPPRTYSAAGVPTPVPQGYPPYAGSPTREYPPPFGGSPSTEHPPYGNPPPTVRTPTAQVPPQSCSQSSQPYPPQPSQPYPPQSSQSYSPQLPQPYPPQPAQSYFPQPVQPYPPQPTQPYLPQPPQSYPQPPQLYPPQLAQSYPPRPQSYLHQPAQPYPPYGGYPPAPAAGPVRDLDLPDPYLQTRYQSPLPLPDGSLGSRTPAAPKHMHTRVSSQPQAQPKQQQQQPSKQAPPPRQPTGPNELEKEEAERQRQLREQEERDMELARQLDLELNLEQEGGGDSVASTASMPGGL